MDLLGHDPKHVEAVLVAADRLREAYEAMMEGRDVGWLADWQPAPTRGAVDVALSDLMGEALVEHPEPTRDELAIAIGYLVLKRVGGSVATRRSGAA